MNTNNTQAAEQHAAKRRWLNAHEEGYHKAMGNRQKALEEKGLWRRAAAVYSDMFGIACSSVEVARIAKRRKECLRQAGRA